MRAAAALILLTALAGCGVRADLKPQAGKTLPQAPYGRGDKLTSAQLLESTPQAAPQRSVELRQRSEERTDDPYDLPPKE
jgi:predicted small lipoprotein YifL